MSALTLLVLFVAAMAALYVAAKLVKQRPPTVAEVTASMTNQLDATRLAIGFDLLPALRGAISAFAEFEEAMNEAEKVMAGENALESTRFVTEFPQPT